MERSSFVDPIGSAPLVLPRRASEASGCAIIGKADVGNAGQSVKDRAALLIIEDAERKGLLRPGGTIVEATAGNTGLGLAQVGVLKGYRILLIVPDKMSREKIQHLRAMGVDVRITRSDVGKGHPEYYQDMAERLAATIPGAIYINQFANPANPKAHQTTTGPEILAQMEGDVDAVVAYHPARLGARPVEPSDIERLSAPVQIHSGTDDGNIPVSALRELEAMLAGQGTPNEVHVYEGAQHGFLAYTRPNRYHPEAAVLSWRRTVEFLTRTLGRD